jgi:hypothetical protein
MIPAITPETSHQEDDDAGREVVAPGVEQGETRSLSENAGGGFRLPRHLCGHRESISCLELCVEPRRRAGRDSTSIIPYGVASAPRKTPSDDTPVQIAAVISRD